MGGAGADTLLGGDGVDTAQYANSTAGISIDLTKSSSTWTGDAQGDVLSSIERFALTDFADIFRGDGGANTARGGRGDDQINGLGGDDILNGQDGDDTVFGGEGNDLVVGDSSRFGAGDDYLQGNGGNDILRGGYGNDRIVGGIGNDLLVDRRGGDFLIGSEGSDIFQYADFRQSQDVTTGDGTRQLDTIADFTQGQDKVDLSIIDANDDNSADGNQAFTFLADPAHFDGDWTGLVWQTVNPQNGIAFINVSTDADADAEMQIYMNHAYTFTAGDFVL